MQSKQPALSLEIADLEKIILSEVSAIESALSTVGLTESTLEKEIRELAKKIDAIEQQIRELERLIAAVRKQVIEEAAVIGATLSMTYMSTDLQAQQYDALFIDEISMAPLLPMFFAMGLVSSSCTLIGDFFTASSNRHTK